MLQPQAQVVGREVNHAPSPMPPDARRWSP
jgi:hypothetical protein